MKYLLAALALSFGSTALLADVDPIRLPPTRPTAVAPANVTPAAAPAKPVTPKPRAKKHARRPHRKAHKKRAK